jgi:hypothetical protein
MNLNQLLLSEFQQKLWMMIITVIITVIIIIIINIIIIIYLTFSVPTKNIGFLEANCKVRNTHKIDKKYKETERK